jgi:hypothetical protein
MFLPFLIVIVFPGWLYLGGYLGYSLTPIPDDGGAPPRFDSETLWRVYFWGGLALSFAARPGYLLTKLADGLIPASARYMISLFMSGAFYSFILFWWWGSPRSVEKQNPNHDA